MGKLKEKSASAHLSKPSLHAKTPKRSHSNGKRCPLGESGVNKGAEGKNLQKDHKYFHSKMKS